MNRYARILVLSSFASSLAAMAQQPGDIAPPFNPDVPAVGSTPAGGQPAAAPASAGQPANATPPSPEEVAKRVAALQAKTAAEKKLKGTVADPDFKQAAELLEPLTPAQIRELDQRSEAVDAAAGSRAAPTATTESIQVTLRPGVPPSRVLLSDAYITTVSLHDVTGEPWPIVRATVGDESAYGVELSPEVPNIVTITPKRKYAGSNLAILLKGASVPLYVSLETTRAVSYYNANLVLDRRGPNAVATTFVPPPNPVDNDLMRLILDGAGAVTPGVRQVEVSGADGTTAFIANGHYYLRTSYSVISPGYSSVVRSAGVSVYEMTASPVIYLSDENGRPITVIPSDTTLIDGALTARASVKNPSEVAR